MTTCSPSGDHVGFPDGAPLARARTGTRDPAEDEGDSRHEGGDCEETTGGRPSHAVTIGAACRENRKKP